MSRRVAVTPARRRPAPTSPAAQQPGSPHQARDALASVLRPARLQRGVHARCAVGFARAGVDGPHLLQQRGVDQGVGRRETVPPGVVARLRHAQCAGHGRNRECGLARAHEPEDPDGTAPWTASPSFPPGERPADASRGRTRPPLERGCRAPHATACSRDAAGPTPRVRPHQGPVSPPPGGPPAGRPARPSCGSPGPWARTRGPGQPGRGPHELGQQLG